MANIDMIFWGIMLAFILSGLYLGGLGLCRRVEAIEKHLGLPHYPGEKTMDKKDTT
jgi:hypothetical protein